MRHKYFDHFEAVTAFYARYRDEFSMDVLKRVENDPEVSGSAAYSAGADAVLSHMAMFLLRDLLATSLTDERMDLSPNARRLGQETYEAINLLLCFGDDSHLNEISERLDADPEQEPDTPQFDLVVGKTYLKHFTV
jgi:hypothetical protein